MMKKITTLLLWCMLFAQQNWAQFTLIKDFGQSKNGVKYTSPLVKFNNELYFMGGEAGGVLRTDGTTLGTDFVVSPNQLFDIATLQVGKNKLFIAGDKKLFSLYNDTLFQIKSSTYGFTDFYQVKDDSFLIASPTTNSRANIWRTNGTFSGTTLNLAIPYLSGFMKGTPYKDFYVFHEKSTNFTKSTPIITDGILANSKEVKEYMTPFVAFEEVTNAVGMGDYIVAEGPVNGFFETHISNGTVAGTKQVQTWGNLVSSYKVNNKWFLVTESSLYVLNETTQELEELVFDNVDYFSTPTKHKDKLYFHDKDGFVWQSDGTAANTKQVSQNNIGSTYFDAKLWGNGDSLFYSVRSNNTKQWRVINLTTLSDNLFVDTGLDLNFTPAIGAIGDQIIFTKYDAASGLELWKYGKVVITPLLATIKQTADVLCFGDKTAKLEVTGSGGLAPYTYKWDKSSSTTNIASNLGSGAYAVTITDAQGKTITASATIKEPTKITLTTTAKAGNPQFKNGNATVAATGGTSPFKYVWNTIPAQTTATATNLAPGIYAVTATDANNCAATTTVTVSLSTNSNEVWEKYGIATYPNPTTSQLYIDMKDVEAKGLELFDMQGKVVLQRSLTNGLNYIDVSEFAEGVYLLKCIIHTGEFATSTIVIKK